MYLIQFQIHHQLIITNIKHLTREDQLWARGLLGSSAATKPSTTCARALIKQHMMSNVTSTFTVL